MQTKRILSVAALSLLLPLAAQAQPPRSADTGITAEIRRELGDARREVRAELAKAKQDLDTGDLQLQDSLQFGKQAKAKRTAAEKAAAAITPQGDLLIDGKPQEIDAGQRRQLLAYRGLVVEIAKVGIDIGQKSADAALDAVDGSWVSLMFGAMTGSLERRIERTVREQVEPGVRGICRMLPRVMDSQQRLAASLPQFRPYATLERDDVADCENNVRREFASL
ncbi:hypothetical protein [Thermomonas sp. LB-4]|jgi:hypothetical protein|uniref:hypothetical protein n=1 Tax=Thermomonas sp. LB-4 TaxID=3102790 RepID=UPI00086A11A4|nr:MAG: hypothetical protein ABS98_16710 [Xanthomonadaceae bacterium SCN 69-48]